MDQGSESTTSAQTNGDVEVTVVLKKQPSDADAAVVEEVTDAVATIKLEKQASTQKSVSSETEEVEEEDEIEEVIVEEVEETDSESGKEEVKSTVIENVQSSENSANDQKASETIQKEDTSQIVEETKIEERVIKEEHEASKVLLEDVVDETEEEEDQPKSEASIEKKKEATIEQQPSHDSVDGSEQTVGPSSEQQSKQENVSNTIKEIISDIDSNIREQERIAQLKEEEYKLMRKQQELAKQIQEQELLAQKLVSQNDFLQRSQYQQQQQQQQQHQQQQQQQYQPNQSYQPRQSAQPPQAHLPQTKYEQNYQQDRLPQTTVSKFSTYEETKDGNMITQKRETIETEESSNVSKHIDLQKIFTPATDAEQIQPKNRKLYASSAFYSPTHPTVEDQVELARRISHSLSDISNQQSKGQSMYVNRKKRSVKWVHEGQAGLTSQDHEFCEEQHKENAEMKITNEMETKRMHPDKVPLRLLMNPRGQIRDFNSLRDSINVETGLLSPEKCAELVSALQAQKGRGAELFAKRRKRAEKWVVDELNASTQNPSGLPDYHPYQATSPRPPTSPSILPAYSDAGKHRVQLNLHQEQVLEKYARPGLKVVKSPWEAALETGSASTAFVEPTNPLHQKSMTPIPSPAPAYIDPAYQSHNVGVQSAPAAVVPQYKPSSYNDHQRDLAYKPSVPQGWKAPSVSLPRELYLPKEIPLESYAPPPVINFKPTNSSYPYNYQPSQQQELPPQQQHSWAPSSGSGFPLADKRSSSFRPEANTYAHFPTSVSTPPKQQYWEPTSYQKEQPTSASQKVPQVNFNPSPLPYEKLAMFEGSDNDNNSYYSRPSPQHQRYLTTGYNSNKIRNTSPSPFGGCRNTPQQQQQKFNIRSPTSTQFSSSQQSSPCNASYSPIPPNHFNTNELMHGPTFNTAARGWKSSGGGGGNTNYGRSIFSPKSHAPLTTAGDMPYTDF